MDRPALKTEDETRPIVEISMEMFKAGLRAFQEWDSEKDEAAMMVAEVFIAMTHAPR